MERKEELRFNSYWEENLKELTVKHIWLEQVWDSCELSPV